MLARQRGDRRPHRYSTEISSTTRPAATPASRRSISASGRGGSRPSTIRPQQRWTARWGANYALTSAFTVRAAFNANWTAQAVDTQTSTILVATGVTPCAATGFAAAVGRPVRPLALRPATRRTSAVSSPSASNGASFRTWPWTWLVPTSGRVVRTRTPGFLPAPRAARRPDGGRANSVQLPASSRSTGEPHDRIAASQ